MKKLIFILLSLIFLHSCADRDFILPEQELETRLAVMAELKNDEIVRVRVSRTGQITDPNLSYRVTNATVILYKDGEPSITVNHEPEGFNSCTGANDGPCLIGDLYRSVDKFEIEYGSYYHIEVSAPGFETVISEPVLAEQKMSNVRLNPVIRDTFSISFDGERRPYAVIDAVGLSYISENTADEYVLSLAGGFEEVLLPSSVPEYISLLTPFDDGYVSKYYRSFAVQLERIPAEYVRVRELIWNQNGGDITGPYATSIAPIPTNMINGYGYFYISERYTVEHILPE